MGDKATAGHLAADIRRAVARLDRAVILWGGQIPEGAVLDEEGGWDGATFSPQIEKACSAVVWAKDRATRWERRLGARCYAITQAMRLANASITRAAPFLTEW
jgi:hypothetical protein